MAVIRTYNDVRPMLGSSLAIIAALAEPAEAHPIVTTISSNNFFQGLIHPLTGIDHWTTMFALGILAAYMGGGAKWRLPIFFVVSMIFGALVGLLPFSHNLATCTEFLIAASALCLGSILLFAAKPSESALLLVISGVGIWHGFAHGHEMPVITAHSVDYFLGFTLTTSVVLSAGLSTINLPIIRTHQRAYVRYSGVFLVMIASNLLLQQLAQHGA